MIGINNVNTTERLIQEVRARPPLWDQRNINYHNRVVVNALWQDIADLLKINKETVKVKWKGLRDTYRRELKKQRSMATVNGGFENTRDPSWAHYSSMNFLREYMGSSNNQTDLFQFAAWSAEDALPDCDNSPTEEAFNSFVSRANLMDMDIPKDGYASETPDTDDDASPSTLVKVKEEPNNTALVGTETSRKRRKSGGGDDDDDHSAESPSGREDVAAEHTAAVDEMVSSCVHHEKHANSDGGGGGVNCAREVVSVRVISSQVKERKLRTKLLRKNSKGHSVSPRSSPSPGGGGMFVAASQDDSDDDLYFFKSLIPYVKSLSPTRKLCLRAEIHNLVLREIMAECNSTPTSVIPLEHVSVGLNA